MLDTVNIFKVNFRRNAINEEFLFTCALRLIRERVVHTSSGVRLCNILLPPASKMLKGILVWDCPWVSLSVSRCIGYAHTRSRTVGDRILEFHMWINYANERAICLFFRCIWSCRVTSLYLKLCFNFPIVIMVILILGVQ